MPKDETDYLTEKIKESINYLEFGSGGSTILASKYVKNKIISIESDKYWYNTLNTQIQKDNVLYYLVDLQCAPNTWGHPSAACPESIRRRYSCIVDELPISDVDTVLIDGRFRVACALHIHRFISKNTVVLFDDFQDRREHYDIVLNYYDIVRIIGRMAHLQKKDNVVPNDIISKYELIAS